MKALKTLLNIVYQVDFKQHAPYLLAPTHFEDKI